jgi:hypothetical protein
MAIQKITSRLMDSDLSIQTLTVNNTFTQGTTNYVQNMYIMHGSTTNSTETEIFSINNNSRIPVPTDSTIFYEASIVARRTDATGESGAWHLKGCADNFSGTVADVGDVYEIAVSQDDINWAVDIRADDSDNSIDVFCTGSANKDVNWTAVIKTIEVHQ